ncbi:hypothetical protein PIB30_098762, partial [Stylosanthes scabra]|nr:hypothetical protein [Stylosanthes scabra]
KCHRTRCSPSELAKTYAVLSNEKKALVHEMGFGALAENVSNYNFSNLIMELVDSFHIPDSTIRTNIGRFKEDATKVGHALGMNATGGLYRQKMLKKEVPPEQYEAADKYRKKSLADLRDMVTQIQLDTKEGITNFKRAFILYVQKAKNLKSVDGCVFALLIIYFQETHFGVDSEEPDAQPPWLVYWKDSMLKQRIKYEFEDPAGLAHQARSGTLTRPQKIIKTKIKIPPTKKEIMKSTLVKSLQIEGPPLQKKILGKRKQIEEQKSSSESEPESESESESETASDSDFEKTLSEDEKMTATGVESAEEENTHQNGILVDAAIEMAPPKNILPASEEEDASIASVLTNLVERITTHPNVEPEKNLEESVTRPEEEASEQELTFRDLSETQKATSLQKQPVIVLALEKAGEKESVAVPREPEKAEPTQRDLADSGEYLNFTPPPFKLLSSQDEPQQEEIRGEEVKAVGPVNEPSSQEFEEEIVYTQGTLDRLDKEMNDAQMKIAEKKLERILKLRKELRDLENAETPQKPETSRTRIYNWATQCTQTNQYEFLFNFKTGKAYQAMM